MEEEEPLLGTTKLWELVGKKCKWVLYISGSQMIFTPVSQKRAKCRVESLYNLTKIQLEPHIIPFKFKLILKFTGQNEEWYRVSQGIEIRDYIRQACRAVKPLYHTILQEDITFLQEALKEAASLKGVSEKTWDYLHERYLCEGLPCPKC